MQDSADSMRVSVKSFFTCEAPLCAETPLPVSQLAHLRRLRLLLAAGLNFFEGHDLAIPLLVTSGYDFLNERSL